MSGGRVEIAFRGAVGRFSLDAALTAPAHGVTGIFGSSGGGKTTLLRCVAGLTRLAGRCVVAGEVWQDEARFLPPHRRAIGYVFQEASLFPHMNVEGNLLYGRRGRRPGRGEGAIGFEEVAELLGLGPLLERAPAHLSGGERQRVAVGRALLSQPRLLLLDEPLSALDRRSKDEILPFLERLLASLRLPALYVSHDMGEIERLADHLALIEAGRVIASGPIAEIQTDPSLPLAGSREASVALEAIVESLDEVWGLATLAVAGGRIVAPAEGASRGARLRVRVAAGDVSLALRRVDTSTIMNILPARILAVTPAGENARVVVLGLGEAGEGARLLARVTRHSLERLGLAPGRDIFAQVKSVSLRAAARRGDEAP